MRKILIFTIFAFFWTNLFAQKDSNGKIKNIEKIFSSIKNLNDSLKTTTLIDAFKKYKDSDDYISSIIILEKILKLPPYTSDSSKYKKLRMSVNTNIGQFYNKLGMYSKSLKFSSKALIDAKSINDTLLIVTNLINIGGIYNSLMLPELSKKTFLQALNYVKENKDPKQLSIVYNNIGNYYSSVNEFDSAIYFFKKSNSFNYKNSLNNKAGNYNNIGNIYLSQNKLDSAFKYFYLAKKILNQTIDSQLKAILYNNIAYTFFKSNKIDSAKFFAQKSLEFANKGNFYNEIIDNYKVSALIFTKNNDIEKSIFYQKKYTSLKDSITSINQQTIVSRIELLNNINRKEIEISKLEAINKYQSLKFKILVFVSLFIFIISIIILFQKRKIKKAYNMLVKDSILVKDLREEITELRKELNQQKKIIFDLKEEDILLSETSHTSLTKEQLDFLEYKIRKAFDEDKIYLNRDLNTTEFAKIIGSNRSYISQVIKNRLNTNFSDLVNTYRVNEAKKLLLQDNFSQYTLETIAYKTGFNSKTTFNRYFKKITGVTPSFFIKTAKTM